MNFGAHPLTLRQLQYALAVAELRSFRRAAQLCFVSQPSLSAQIAELERSLGVQLFERDRRQVLITPAGEELVERARRMLLLAEDLRDAAARRGDLLTGTLRLGVIPTIAPYLLPDIDPVIRAEYPGLMLRWTEDKTELLVEKIGRGELDAVLVALESELGSLAHETIGEDPFVLAAPREHRLGRKSGPLRVSTLAAERVLLLDDGHCFRDQALELCARTGAEELGFRATSLATLAQMALGGAGVTMLPRLAVEVENRRGLLTIREFTKPRPRRTLVLAWRRNSPLATSLKELTAVARKAFREATRG